jgi:hypothetical protein
MDSVERREQERRSEQGEGRRRQHRSQTVRVIPGAAPEECHKDNPERSSHDVGAKSLRGDAMGPCDPGTDEDGEERQDASGREEIIQWGVIALSRDYHDVLSRAASLLTAIEPEDEELTPRIRLDFPWMRKKLSRRIRPPPGPACSPAP